MALYRTIRSFNASNPQACLLSTSSSVHSSTSRAPLSPDTIFAVLVTFNPDQLHLRKVLSALKAQVAGLVLIDNGSHDAAELGLLATDLGAEWIPLARNEGIAVAQNVGIGRALSTGAGAVLLMDQDTLLPTEAVRRLAETLNEMRSQGIRVGSVGCAFQDTHDGRVADVWRAQGLAVARTVVTAGASEPVETDFVIASGSLLPADVLNDVGLMDGPLFIDLVDLEWGFRAAEKGYRHFQSAQVVMDHTIGAGRVKLGSRSIALHAPVRNYYWVRNALLMARRNYVAPAWRLYFVRRALTYLIVYTLKGDRRWQRFGLMLRALLHGLVGRAGPLHR